MADINYKIEMPKVKTTKATILLPGISGNALNDERYTRLSKAFIKSGVIFIRVNLWERESDLINFSIDNIHAFLDKTIKLVKNKGITDIILVGVSFGAGVLLTYKNDLTKKMILWAPAITFGEKSNFDEIKNQKLLNILPNFMNIKINKNDIKHIAYPVLILHGSNDSVVSLSNSQFIEAASDNIKLQIIENSKHGLRSNIEDVVNQTVHY